MLVVFRIRRGATPRESIHHHGHRYDGCCVGSSFRRHHCNSNLNGQIKVCNFKHNRKARSVRMNHDDDDTMRERTKLYYSSCLSLSSLCRFSFYAITWRRIITAALVLIYPLVLHILKFLLSLGFLKVQLLSTRIGGSIVRTIALARTTPWMRSFGGEEVHETARFHITRCFRFLLHVTRCVRFLHITRCVRFLLPRLVLSSYDEAEL